MNTYVAGVLHKKDKFLLLYHRDIDRWVFPGGKPESGETVKSSLLREVKEEIGVNVLASQFHSTHIHDVNNKEWVGLFFAVSKWEGLPCVKEQTKHSGIRWMTIDEMKSTPNVAQQEITVAASIATN